MIPIMRILVISVSMDGVYNEANVIILLKMDKGLGKKTPSSVERDEKRLTTAPIRERPKYSEMYKTNGLQLPVIRGKNLIGREPVVASRDFKRGGGGRKQQSGKGEHEAQQIHKRPQTSKGSRNTNKKQSQYYQQGEDDLIMTSMQEKIDLFKKISKQHTCSLKHP